MLAEIVERIKKAGINNTRISQDQSTGKARIEILTNSGWVTIRKDLTQSMAEDIVRQASSRVILG